MHCSFFSKAAHAHSALATYGGAVRVHHMSAQATLAQSLSKQQHTVTIPTFGRSRSRFRPAAACKMSRCHAPASPPRGNAGHAVTLPKSSSKCWYCYGTHATRSFIIVIDVLRVAMPRTSIPNGRQALCYHVRSDSTL